MSKDMTMEEATIFAQKIKVWVGRFAILVVCIGAIAMVVSLTNYHYAKISSAWIPVDGIITESYVKEFDSGVANSTHRTSVLY